MSGPAQVRSTESIEAFQAALARFQQRATAALDALDAEIRRAGDWVDHDRPSYWKKATHEAEDAVHQAKLELERCRMFTVDGQRPACREQEAAYKAAQVRCTYCRDKVEVVRKWQRNYRHESIEYSGRVGQLRRALEQDVPNARLLLVKILRRLEEYQVERPPEAMDTAAAVQTTPLDSRTQRPPTDKASASTPDQPDGVARRLVKTRLRNRTRIWAPPISTPAPPTSATPLKNCKPPGSTPRSIGTTG